jgi:LEA14-like dessication related protein
MRPARLLSIGIFALLTYGCEKVNPPQIAPDSVTTLTISPEFADVEVMLDAANPNKNALTATGIDSKVTIGGKPGVARAVVNEPLTIPGGQRIKLKMPLRVMWTDPAAIAALAATKQPADYLVEASVLFVTKGARVEIPFQIRGSMTASELARAAGVAPQPSAQPSATPSAQPKPSAAPSAKPR